MPDGRIDAALLDGMQAALAEADAALTPLDLDRIHDPGPLDAVLADRR